MNAFLQLSIEQTIKTILFSSGSTGRLSWDWLKKSILSELGSSFMNCSTFLPSDTMIHWLFQLNTWRWNCKRSKILTLLAPFPKPGWAFTTKKPWLTWAILTRFLSKTAHIFCCRLWKGSRNWVKKLIYSLRSSKKCSTSLNRDK